MRTLAAIAAVLTLLLSAQSAYAGQVCPVGMFPQADMAGIYVDPSSPMRVEIYPCGHAMIVWDNAYGRHGAGYASYDRLVGSGVIAMGFQPDPIIGGYLDDSPRVAFKAAEPGYIQVGTFGLYDDTVRVYHLKKIS